MHINLDHSAPLPRTPAIGLKIAAFLASLALAAAGILYGTMAATAYIGGDLVGAIGKGADRVASETAGHAETAGATDGLHQAATAASDFALRAKLIALAIGLLAAALLLGGELVRRRYPHKAVVVVLGIAVAGQAALAILSKPSGIEAFGVAACALGVYVWTRVRRDAATGAMAT